MFLRNAFQRLSQQSCWFNFLQYMTFPHFHIWQPWIRILLLLFFTLFLSYHGVSVRSVCKWCLFSFLLIVEQQPNLSHLEVIIYFNLWTHLKPLPCCLIHLRILGLVSSQILALHLFQTHFCHQLITVSYPWQLHACYKRRRDKKHQKKAVK